MEAGNLELGYRVGDLTRSVYIFIIFGEGEIGKGRV